MPSSTVSRSDVSQVSMSVSSAGPRRGRVAQHPRAPPRATDYHTEHDTDHRAASPRIGQRSQSLSALQPAAVIQPRMAQLETLEAKMASIEVSLSCATPRRRKCVAAAAVVVRDRGAVRTPPPPPPPPLLADPERRHLQERVQRLHHDQDNTRLAIRNLKLALDRLDITDNIDVRIQQAELEYQLGREELNLLTLLEEARAAQARLDEGAAPPRGPTTGSVHALVHAMGGCARLLALHVKCSREQPSFGTAVRPDGIYIEWSDRDTGLKKGDRVVEINGKLLITRTPSAAELSRLYLVRPEAAQLVVLRAGAAGAAAEVGPVRQDGLRADNLRLTHRISYLEEQVSELLASRPRHDPRPTPPVQVHHDNHNVTNINIGNGDVQVFQKGPQVTALVGAPARPPPPVRVPSSPCIAASDEEARPRVQAQERRRRADARSVKSLELELVGPRRPTPPQKPLRLSLHRAQSLQSVEPPGPGPTTAAAATPEPHGRKRTRERSVSGLRWTQVQMQRQTARWC